MSLTTSLLEACCNITLTTSSAPIAWIVSGPRTYSNSSGFTVQWIWEPLAMETWSSPYPATWTGRWVMMTVNPL